MIHQPNNFENHLFGLPIGNPPLYIFSVVIEETFTTLTLNDTNRTTIDLFWGVEPLLVVRGGITKTDDKHHTSYPIKNSYIKTPTEFGKWLGVIYDLHYSHPKS